jgi:CheY-like chemotaxis protein
MTTLTCACWLGRSCARERRRDRGDYRRGSACAGPRAAPDLVLLDLRLPGMDGFAVLREPRSDPLFSGLPVVVVSAFADRSSIDAAFAEGATRYVTKPFDRDELIGVIAEEIRRASDVASKLTPDKELILEALRLESPVLGEINRWVIANGGEPIPPRQKHLEQARDSLVSRAGARQAASLTLGTAPKPPPS